MSQFYIYNANLPLNDFKKVTVIFNPSKDFNYSNLRDELYDFFKNSAQSDGIIFFYGEDKSDFENELQEKIDLIFKSIPKVEETTLSKNLFFIKYNENKILTSSKKKIEKYIKEIVRQGLVNIFIKNGGLVESKGISHHFKFPSGKHSAKFLRTANVLLNKSEIDFIAINTLHLICSNEFENIYCDTLSINVIGYSIINFLKRFNSDRAINIESFKSYDGLYNKNTIFNTNSVFLISASTSGGILEHIKRNHSEISINSICFLFYLPLEKKSNVTVEQVLCDLTFNKDLNYGIEEYEIYNTSVKQCRFCENHSKAINIIGDSFSIDEPIVESKQITVGFIKKEIKDFVELFKFKNTNDIGTTLKVSYAEDTANRKKYDLYIDYEKIINNLKEYPKHQEKLDSYIQQYIPASIKYIIHLNDKGSQGLAEYISDSIKPQIGVEPTIVNHSELSKYDIHENTVGSILIVGSCISNGKNLLYLSRYFRNYASLRLIYFIGINRVNNQKQYDELRSNIKYGLYGPENSTFIEIEKIFCDNTNTETSWIRESDFLKQILEESDEICNVIKERISTLDSFSSSQVKGGSNNIFYNSIDGKELRIRQNSAFFNDNSYYQNICQSDIYFTISCILNNMRTDKNKVLYQTSFVRNLLTPLVFNRFNDGVIQASILRAAKDEELNYSISENTSLEMLSLLLTFLKHKHEYQGEAVYEFLYALSIGKLRLFKPHYLILIGELKNHQDEVINIFEKSITKIYQKSI
ncbi:hypothetical protein C1637_09575 [Chryseobacterium lactis]|uniref:Uncharacterized protein n=1 Tax=Chryseobacterium lactis TaxID=1241981 RepID=A0A3G6RM64_CHRLC|nr:hypothetical protein [Chryseobacterium lactis]AZA82239.1 hypothetical protein EG342_10130 [Chryseobacterium lactis]AZB02620.1 hypothetical protein EG341_00985 [Chryseobacterium lactis]PNW14086.1 hypothetical protein C1637_09575 [Chryseobacterium lactis]